MNIKEYIKLKLEEVDYFLKGVYFENINVNYEIIVENMLIEGNFHNLDFMNRSRLHRKLTEETLLKIKGYRYELEQVDLAFLSVPMGNMTEEEKEKHIQIEVDKAVEKFIKLVMLELNNLRDNVLNKFYREKNDKKQRVSLLYTDLDFFKIKLGSKEFNWEEISQKQKINEDKKQPVVIDDLRLALYYIYSLPNKIEDKRNKLATLEAFSEYAKDNLSQEKYGLSVRYYGKLRNESFYDNFAVIYSELLHKIPEYNDFLIELLIAKNIEQQEEKPITR